VRVFSVFFSLSYSPPLLAGKKKEGRKETKNGILQHMIASRVGFFFFFSWDPPPPDFSSLAAICEGMGGDGLCCRSVRLWSRIQIFFLSPPPSFFFFLFSFLFFLFLGGGVFFFFFFSFPFLFLTVEAYRGVPGQVTIFIFALLSLFFLLSPFLSFFPFSLLFGGREGLWAREWKQSHEPVFLSFLFLLLFSGNELGGEVRRKRGGARRRVFVSCSPFPLLFFFLFFYFSFSPSPPAEEGRRERGSGRWAERPFLFFFPFPFLFFS